HSGKPWQQELLPSQRQPGAQKSRPSERITKIADDLQRKGSRLFKSRLAVWPVSQGNRPNFLQSGKLDLGRRNGSVQQRLAQHAGSGGARRGINPLPVFPENIRDQAAASATRQHDLKQAKFFDL